MRPLEPVVDAESPVEAIPPPPVRAEGGASFWRWGVALLGGLTLLLGGLLLSWGAGVCLDSYTSTRVLPDGRTVDYVVCLDRHVAWALLVFGAATVAGGTLAVFAGLIGGRHKLGAALIAIVAGSLAMPVGGMSQSLALFTVPVGLILLGISPLVFPARGLTPSPSVTVPPSAVSHP